MATQTKAKDAPGVLSDVAVARNRGDDSIVVPAFGKRRREHTDAEMSRAIQDAVTNEQQMSRNRCARNLLDLHANDKIVFFALPSDDLFDEACVPAERSRFSLPPKANPYDLPIAKRPRMHVDALRGKVVYFCGDSLTRVSPTEMRALIARHGGKVVDSVDDQVTHVVFAGDYSQIGAINKLQKPIISEDWVMDSIDFGLCTHEERYVISAAPFRGATFYLPNMYYDTPFSHLTEVISTFGGAVVGSFTSSVTHYVAGDTTSYDECRSAFKQRVPVVLEDFLKATVARGCMPLDGAFCVSETLFAPFVAAHADTVGAMWVHAALPRKEPLCTDELLYNLSDTTHGRGGFYCVLPSCGELVYGEAPDLRRHMHIHHKNGEWTPPEVGHKWQTRIRQREGRGWPSRQEAKSTRSSARKKKEAGLEKCAVLSCVGDTTDMLQCSECKRKLHKQCIHLPNTVLPRPGWKCGECKKCEKCNNASEHTDEYLLFCEKCDSGFHTFCLTPQLTSIPETAWLCTACLAST